MHGIYNSTNYIINLPNIVKSDGIYLFDHNGKRYMDLESGVWCTSLGHRHPRINRIMQKQAESLLHAGFCYSHAIVEEAAEAVLSITAFDMGKCVFLSSGSEAIELARQMAKHVTGKKMSMTLHDSYLGSYSSLTNRQENWYIFNWDACKECPAKNNCEPECEHIRNIPNTIADFIFEPGSASGFVRFPPQSLICNIVDKVRSQGGKIIANEVTTGIGRTGRWFGYNHYAIEPDIVAIGKGIGNGYPVSVTAINESTVRELEKSTFRYMQSHQNDPMGAAIVKEVIHIITDEQLIEKAVEKGHYFLDLLQPLQNTSPIRDIRGQGLMYALDISSEKRGEKVFQDLLNRGYLIGNRKSLFRIDPPLIIEEEEFKHFTHDFKDIVQTLSACIEA